jgi:predicted porin
LGASTLAGSALAQSNVTVYGLIDAGFVHESGGAGPSINKLDSGIAAGSRLGFRGREDLGGGMAANFTLEAGFNIDTGVSGQGALFGRQAHVGLETTAGNVNLGRQYTPIFLTVNAIDPFVGASMAGSGNNMLSEGGIRMNNTLKYAAPKMGPVTAEVAYGFGEQPGSSSRGRAIGAKLGYVQGPLGLHLGYHRSTDLTGASSGRTVMVGGTYFIKDVKLALGLQSNKGLVTINGRLIPGTDTRDLIVGATVPFGVNSLLASYTRKDDRGTANSDASQLAIGVSHALSKRTDLYASIARIDNDAAVGAPRFYTVGNGSSQGTGDKAYNLGVRHLF